MKQFLAVFALACLISIPSFAGEIPSGDAPKPQSQQPTNPTLLGEIPTSDGPELITNSAFSAVLNALGLASI